MTKLIVGLGNPGPRYARTRHNVGFATIVELSDRLHINGKSQGPAIVAEGALGGETVVLAEPTTMMNDSGRAVAWLRRRHNVHDLANLLVISDDMDIQLGMVRLRAQGSSGGHNGIKSIIDAVGTQDFARLRIGLGRPPVGVDPIEFVLQTFRPEERPIIEQAVRVAADAVEYWIANGTYATMDRFNGWRPPAGEAPPA